VYLPRGASSSPRPLENVRTAIKDIFDMEGYVTGYGHPKWRETHAPAREHAESVRLLLSAGARVVGRTHMDELAWSLFGVNAHYGTPRNPRSAGAIPGGSSSGSASAVASGEADLGIGTDTGGSVRVPASFCGLHGIRPTQGRVSLAGARSLAPSFDTLGWFARDAALMKRAGQVLLPSASARPTRFARLLVAADAFQLADQSVQEQIYAVVSESKAEILALFTAEGDKGKSGGNGFEEVSLDLYGSNFDAWFDTFRVLQSNEVWHTLGPWVSEHAPDFGPGVKERFAFARDLCASCPAYAGAEMPAGPTDAVSEASRTREAIRSHLVGVLGLDGVALVPTTPAAAPSLALASGGGEEVDSLRGRLLRLTAIAGLSGLPQVNLPIAPKAEAPPVGLGLIGPPGSDEALLDLSEKLAEIV